MNVRVGSLPALALAVLLILPGQARAQDPSKGDLGAGYGINFSDHSKDQGSPSSVSLPFAFTVALGPRVAAHFGLNSILSTKAADASTRTTGVGDTKVGLTATTPASGNFQLAVDYTAKLPTASSDKGLGSGFVDHQITGTPAWQSDKDGVAADAGVDFVGTGSSHDAYFFTDGYYSRTLGENKGTGFTAEEFDLELDYTPSAHGAPSDAVLIVSAKIAHRGQQGARNVKWTLTPGVLTGLVSSSSRWGAFVSLTYASAKSTASERGLGLPGFPKLGRLLGLGLSGSKR